MDMNAIDQWCSAKRDGSWRAFNDYTGASIKCSSKASAVAIVRFYEEQTEIGMCSHDAIEAAEADLIRGGAPWAAERIWERYDNAAEEIRCMMADALAEFG